MAAANDWHVNSLSSVVAVRHQRRLQADRLTNRLGTPTHLPPTVTTNHMAMVHCKLHPATVPMKHFVHIRLFEMTTEHVPECLPRRRHEQRPLYQTACDTHTHTQTHYSDWVLSTWWQIQYHKRHEMKQDTVDRMPGMLLCCQRVSWLYVA